MTPGFPIAFEFFPSPSPISVYLYLRQKGIPAYWLDSARFHPITGRYSFIGFDPEFTLKSTPENLQSLIPTLRRMLKERGIVAVPDLPPFVGGAIGYLGYDVGRLFEELPSKAKDDLHLPQSEWVWVRSVIAWDHHLGKAWIIQPFYPEQESKKEYLRICQKLKRYQEEIHSFQTSWIESVCGDPLFVGDIQYEMTRREFERMVLAAKGFIQAGHIYQANLSQRLSLSMEGDPLALYLRLRQINPSGFACFLPMSEVTIAGCSPERLLRLEGDKVETRPIAGTKPRVAAQTSEDARLKEELLLSPKERAEHIMLVDLERNDLGRVCEYGSVAVNEFMIVEEYSHVRHIVSNVQGRLRPECDRFDLIAAAFPGGTITGTPKIRSIQIIDQLESVRRQVYTGSVGYLSLCGAMDLNIVIRTFLICRGRAYIQVGAGIVADSDPEREYEETLHKAQALISAIRLFKHEFKQQNGVLSHLEKRTYDGL